MKKIIGDDELIYLVREGSEKAEEYLMARYRNRILPMVISILRKHTCTDTDDAAQLAVWGLRKALERYRPDRCGSFRGFALLCAEREVNSYLRKEYAKGLFVAGKMISIDRMISKDYDLPVAEILPNRTPEFEPAWVFRCRELKSEADKILEGFSEPERKVYYLWKDDYSYKEIGQRTGKSTKEVDLCIQKVKSRLKTRIDYRN